MTLNPHDQKPLRKPGSQSIKGCVLTMFCHSPCWQSILRLLVNPCCSSGCQCSNGASLRPKIQYAKILYMRRMFAIGRKSVVTLDFSVLATFGTTFCAKRKRFQQSVVTQRPNPIHPRLCCFHPFDGVPQLL